MALAVDMYGGSIASNSSEARNLISKVINDENSAIRNLKLAYTYLFEIIKSEKVGVIGWSFGGGWSLQAAILLEEKISASVSYYGRVLFGNFGKEDTAIPVI